MSSFIFLLAVAGAGPAYPIEGVLPASKGTFPTIRPSIAKAPARVEGATTEISLAGGGWHGAKAASRLSDSTA